MSATSAILSTCVDKFEQGNPLLITLSSSKPDQNLLAETHELVRRLHYSIHTERVYYDWIIRFVRFHHLQARAALSIELEQKVEQFLTHLAVQANVAASTQNQALNAWVFLYKRVLERPFEPVQAARSSKDPRIPEVLTREEVKQCWYFRKVQRN